MTEIVLKPFNSATRRFREGDVVRESDDFSPLSYGSLKMRHFIGATPKPTTSSSAKSDKA